ncbi:MAG: hypothetical protein JST00_29145 [Deltaproteobacteria bacterium]|nr:hypothetical protein [Deltaproteobacteria bacterium]
MKISRLLPRSSAPAIAAIAPLALFVVVSATGGCSKYNSTDSPELFLPDQNQFTQAGGVNDFLTARCGSLDCHGQIGRPLRLYSANGLRFEDGDGGRRAAGATTAAEKKENYLAVVGLEPELLSAVAVVASQGGEFNDLLLFKKPLDIKGGGVRHKGGPVLRFGDNGWVCLTGWAAGPSKFNKQACEAGAAGQ